VYKRQVKRDIRKVAETIAKQIVEDGEGATKIGKVIVKNAESEIKAKKIAERVATSELVKTALFGCDPNWGRIAAAAGSVEEFPIDQNRLDIYIGPYKLLENGRPVEVDLNEVSRYMRENKEVPMVVDLKEGNAEWVYYTSDLTYDYVKLNAEYTT
jgi:glutamate N-acetyltransferase/amino-acid N-acetyltransferase